LEQALEQGYEQRQAQELGQALALERGHELALWLELEQQGYELVPALEQQGHGLAPELQLWPPVAGCVR
jgi:hypothetical protein